MISTWSWLVSLSKIIVYTHKCCQRWMPFFGMFNQVVISFGFKIFFIILSQAAIHANNETLISPCCYTAAQLASLASSTDAMV